VLALSWKYSDPVEEEEIDEPDGIPTLYEGPGENVAKEETVVARLASSALAL